MLINDGIRWGWSGSVQGGGKESKPCLTALYWCKAAGETPALGRKTHTSSKSDMLAAEITTSLHLKIHTGGVKCTKCECLVADSHSQTNASNKTHADRNHSVIPVFQGRF